MMNFTTFEIAFTVLSFVVFVGILLWAYSGQRKSTFERLGNLPSEEQEQADNKPTSEHIHV